MLAVAGLILMLATPHFLQAVRILPHVEALHRQAQERFAQLGDGKFRERRSPIATLVLPAASTGEFPGSPIRSAPTPDAGSMDAWRATWGCDRSDRAA